MGWASQPGILDNQCQGRPFLQGRYRPLAP